MKVVDDFGGGKRLTKKQIKTLTKKTKLLDRCKQGTTIYLGTFKFNDK